jgi:hypothetical protein
MNHIKTYHEHLNEGLIKTVDVKKFGKHLRIMFQKFYKDSIAAGTPLIDSDGHVTLMIYNKPKTLEFISELIHQINVHGYYVSGVQYRNIGDKEEEHSPKTADNNEFLEIIKAADPKITKAFQISLEPKFEEEAKGKFTMLYHITEQKHVKKIMEIGLVPRAKSKISYHPERIYFANKTVISQIYDMYKDFVDEPVILKVDVSGIKLYPDINVQVYDNLGRGAYFATTNIPPDKIHVIKENPKTFIDRFKKTKAGKEVDQTELYHMLDNLLGNNELFAKKKKNKTHAMAESVKSDERVVKFKRWTGVIEKAKYGNGRTALTLINPISGNIIAVATVNIPSEKIEDDEVIIKNYSENEGMLDALVAAGIVSEPARTISFGQVTGQPVCKLLI